jgi:hypothetical protein
MQDTAEATKLISEIKDRVESIKSEAKIAKDTAKKAKKLKGSDVSED